MKTSILKVTVGNNEIQEKMQISFEYYNMKPYYPPSHASNAYHLGMAILINYIKRNLTLYRRVSLTGDIRNNPIYIKNLSNRKPVRKAPERIDIASPMLPSTAEYRSREHQKQSYLYEKF